MRSLMTSLPALQVALQDAREYTLTLYKHVTEDQRNFPRLPIVNPPQWELGHIGWFQEYWCLRHRPGKDALPPRLPNADAMLDSAMVPHEERWKLNTWQWDSILAYLDSVLNDTLAASEKSAPEERYFFQLALFHEDMHGEALLMTLQTLGLPGPKFRPFHLPRPKTQPIKQEVEYAGGKFMMGAGRASEDFVFDNEKWAHEVELPPFAISCAAVSNEQYIAFVEAGGYRCQEFWTPEGWQWLQKEKSSVPRYWKKINDKWHTRRFDRWEALLMDNPVIHVNAYEAEAYCNFVGQRLPSEAEWEYAARAEALSEYRYPWGYAQPAAGMVNVNGMFAGLTPVSALIGSDTPANVRQLIGNVWEWTSSAFTPYPDFATDPYKEYSEPWFHNHRVLRGGCFATKSRLVHNRFRNFYTPDRGDVFAGFRTARTLEPLPIEA
ncbi:MAG: ergothioneine biosynthesis protein EgtB [Betaproteobacteria bacterium]|nr:ergothioneine biosynthesis protein EgtB [Betaproteobacteria bacterium]